jgi:hypothetical protein
MKKQETKQKHCRTCGVEFTSIRTAHGGFRSTCSMPCRLVALERYIAVMQKQRDKLAAEIAATPAT